MNASSHRIGIDLGGTKIEAVLLDIHGAVQYRHRVPTPRNISDPETEYDGIVSQVIERIEDCLSRAPEPQACTVGVGIPGTVNPQSGRVQNANTTSLIGKPLQKELESRLGRPVGMDNDANCFTLAEARQGAGQGHNMVFGVIMGTGCGGGLSINGKIHRGTHRIAGEWGHFSVDPSGAPCYCGNRGCVETKISGGGVEQAYERQFGQHLSMQAIEQGWQDGDQNCRVIFDQFLEDFGRCLGGLISILDPDAVVLGGGLSNIDELYSLGIERVRRYAFHEKIETPIVKNQMGDSAGVLGAAWIGV